MEAIYFSNASNNTHRFVEKLDRPGKRIPLRSGDPHLTADSPYILITPTYGAGRDNGAVPKQVIKFLNDPHNRTLLRGVVASGNTNFGKHYCLAGDIIAEKCEVPVLHRFEILGTPEDVTYVQTLLDNTEWKHVESD